MDSKTCQLLTNLLQWQPLQNKTIFIRQIQIVKISILSSLCLKCENNFNNWEPTSQEVGF